MVKNPPSNSGDARDVSLIPGLGSKKWSDPWSKKLHPTPLFLPGKFHGQTSPVGYSPLGHRESDIPEHAFLHLKKNLYHLSIHSYLFNTGRNFDRLK